MTTNNFSTDTLTIRKAYVGLFAIDGFLKVYDDAFFYKNLFFYHDIYIYGNTHQHNKLYLGANDIMYLYGDNSGIGVNTITPTAIFDIQGNTVNIFKAQSSNTNIENFTSINGVYNAVSTGGNIDAAFVNFYDTSQTTEPDTRLISMDGNLYINTDKTTIVESRMIIANKTVNPQHLDVENFTVYGTANKLFNYDLYGNTFSYAGTSITAIAPDINSTTFINISVENKKGIGIGGGVLPNDNTMSFGTIGTYDSSGYFIMSQTFASKKNAMESIIKKSTVGYNTVTPATGNYVIDINGPTIIRMGEINSLLLTDIEITCLRYCESNPLYGIAVGSPIEDYTLTGTTNRFKQYILYTTDGGIYWNKSRVKDISSSVIDDLEDGIYYFNTIGYQTPEFVVIAGDNNYMYYSTDYGSTWTKYSYYQDYVDFVIEDAVQTVTTTSILVKDNIIFAGYQNDETEFTYTRGFYSYIIGDNPLRYKINPFGDVSKLDFVNVAKGTGNYVYFLANIDSSGSFLFKYLFDYTANNFVYNYPVPYTFFSGETFQYHYNGDYGEFLVGTCIYYMDRGMNWTKSSYTVPTGATINYIEPIDDLNAVAVGSYGTFIYTTDGGITWDTVPDFLLNAYGNSYIINGVGINLLQIKKHDIDTFIITYCTQTFEYSVNSGVSKIYHCYIPTLFNRAKTFVLDICGCVSITGDLHVNEGGKIYNEGGIYSNGEIVSNTSMSVTGTATNTDYFAMIGTIDNPEIQVSQGTLGIQGQNGMNNYNTWKFQVGATEAGVSSYDTKRLRLVDETENATERLTVNSAGQVGIGTSTPVSLLDISGVTTVSDTTQSTGVETGALQVLGGAAIIKSLYVGGETILINTTESTSVATGALQVRGGVGIAKALYIGGNITISTTEETTSPTTGALMVAGGVGVTQSVFVGGNVTVWDTTVTTSPTTGAVLVAGGVGVTQSVFVGGNVTVWDTTVTTSPSTGAVLVSGGVGVSQSVFVGGNVTVWDTTETTSPTTGALLVVGGAGITGNLYTGTNADIAGILNSQTGITVKSTETNVDLYVAIGSIDNPELQVSQGTLAVQGQNGMNSYNTWNFQVGATEVGTSSYDTKRLRVVDETGDGAERLTIDSAGQVGIGTTEPASLLDVSGVVTVSDTTQSTSVTTGALQVLGGAAITKSVFVGGNVTVCNTTVTTSPTTGALLVAGGVGMAQSVFVGGNVTVWDTTAATSPTTGALLVAGGVGVAQSVFVAGNVTVWDTTAATSPTTGALLVSGGVGVSQSVFVGGNVTVWDTTTATSPTTGALLVVGGVGVAESVFVGGNVTVWDTTAATSPTTGALLVTGGAGITGNVYTAAAMIAVGEIYTNTGIAVSSTETNADFYVAIGSIENPDSQISQATLAVQGQNGMNSYNTWKFQVGATEAGTSSYNTKRLRIVDETANSAERLTVDSAGQVGIGTTEPASLLDVSGVVTVSDTTQSTSVATGALQVLGGAAITKNLYIGNSVYVAEEIQVMGSGYFENIDTVGNVIAANLYISGYTSISGNISIASGGDVMGDFQVAGTADFGKDMYITGNTVVGGDLYVSGNINLNTIILSSLVVNGGTSIGGNVYIGGYVNTENIISSTSGVEITGTETGKDYYTLIGSISDPTTTYSQGTLILQGQNGLENYSRWNITVGAYESATNTYDTTRLKIVDSKNSAERMTIDMNGYVGIGTKSPDTNLHIAGNGKFTGDLAVIGQCSASSFTTTSDYRIKEHIKPLSPNISVLNLRPVSYFNVLTQKEDIGLIAHEVQEKYPFMVLGEKDGERNQSINYTNIVTAMINDIKMLKEEIRELREKKTA